MREKLKKFLGILIVLPILVGVFCGVVEAAEIECETAEDCKEAIVKVQENHNELVLLQKAFFDCWEKFGDASIYITDERTKGESCEVVNDEAKAQANAYAETNGRAGGLVALEDIREELGKERKDLGNQITAMKLVIQGEKTVDVKSILAIGGQNPFSDAESFLDGVIDLLIKMVGVAALVLLVVGGFRLVVAAGNDNEIQKAKSMIQYAIVGLAIALLAYIIVAAVQGILYR